MNSQPLGHVEVEVALKTLPGWAHSDGELTASFIAESSARAVEMLIAIAHAAENQDHHPDLLWSYTDITVALSSHDIGAITARDVTLAQTVSAIAQEYNAKVDTGQG